MNRATKEWYISRGAKQVGPLSIAQIERNVEKGKIPAGSLFWRDGMADPLPASELPELGVALAEPPRKGAKKPERASRSSRLERLARQETKKRRKRAESGAKGEAPRRTKKRAPEPSQAADEPAPRRDEKRAAKRAAKPAPEAKTEAQALAPGSCTYHGQVELPPVPAEASPLRAASLFVKLKKIVVMLGACLFVGGLAYGLGALFDAGWLRIVGYCFAGLGVIAGLLGATAKVADCPYCGAEVGAGSTDALNGLDDDEAVECGHCYELLVSHEGEVRAMDGENASRRKGLEAPLFEGGGWAEECVSCGAEVERFEEANTIGIGWAQLMTGTLSVATASIKDIPYCAEHSKEVGVTIRDDKYPRLVFQNLDARRRYVHLNRACAPSKI